MNSEEIGKRFYESSVKVMERNRTLLFTINLIAALLLVIVYLENMSFDDKQRKGHLIAYKDICDSLKGKVGDLNLTEEEKLVVDKCIDLPAISGVVVSKKASEETIKGISNDLFRLYRIQNEMKAAKLESAIVAPLGFGMPVPRNDLIIICGVILVMLYTWLAFSFKQHARIIVELSDIFKDNEMNSDTNERRLKIFNRLIEANFMFKTSEKTLASIFVKLLYFAAPISMSVATINDLIIDRSGSWRSYLNEILQIPRIIEVAIVVILWFIAYNINQSDKESNTVAEVK